MHGSFFLLGLAAWALTLIPAAPAADISPSREVVPEKYRNPPGKRFSIFSGDPQRVQRANEVNIEAMEANVTVEPTSFSRSQSTEGVVASFTILNKGSKNLTLSFPDAQRFDLVLSTMDDRVLYLWSDDKMFVQQTGMSFLNKGEKIQFTETLSSELLNKHCPPGSYKITMILANYPEITAVTTLTVTQ